MQSRLTEFTHNSRFFDSQNRLTYSISWVTIAVCLLVIVATPDSPGNIYWFFLGTSIGLQCIFRGSLHLLPLDASFSSKGLRLHDRFDKWFPLLQFWVRHLFISISLIALWIQVLDQGLKSTLTMNIFLGFMLIMLPIHSLSHEKYKTNDTPKQYRIHEIVRFLVAFNIATAIGLACQTAVFKPGEDFTKDMPITVVIIWVPIVLYLLSCLVMLIDRLIRAGDKR